MGTNMTFQNLRRILSECAGLPDEELAELRTPRAILDRVNLSINAAA
jgi:hypothetical protein